MPSKSQHILELARELLDDIELGRGDAERLLLKASRLARWVGSDDIQKWIGFEMGGYYDEPVALRYMGLTGRWTDYEKKQGHWGPLAQQEAQVIAETARLAAMRIPDSSGEWANVAIQSVTNAMTVCSSNIAKFSAIRSRVLAQLHKFVSGVYYQLEFDNLSESIFEAYKTEVDSLIQKSCGDVLQKIPSVMSRLADEDEESISQALTTCRRIIDAFADSVYPPTDAKIVLGGAELSLDASKHKNRLNVYISERTKSTSRQQKLGQNLSNLYARVSVGVHNDVTAEEARSLFLNTYLFLGEVLSLRKIERSGD
jgi:hypothetical protein